jgi:hypothetical protein
MKKKKLSAVEAFLALSDAEKERQFREFDKEFVADSFKPLTAADKKLWEKAKARGRGGHGNAIETGRSHIRA